MCGVSKVALQGAGERVRWLIPDPADSFVLVLPAWETAIKGREDMNMIKNSHQGHRGHGHDIEQPF